MPHKAAETLIDAGDSAIQHAPNSNPSHAPKRAVSDAALRALKPKDKPYKHAVGGGLYLEVSTGGSKLWRWKYRIEGKENRYSMGSYPERTLKEAREEVESARKLVKQGLHPVKQKELARIRSAHEQTKTLESIAKTWIALKDWQENTKKRRLDMLTRVVFPTIGQLPIKQITPQIILPILKKAVDNNGVSVKDEAQRTLFGIFEFATESFLVDSNPVHKWRGVLPKNKTQHKRALAKSEIGQLLRDVEGHGGNYQT